jgi:hypothetical protein
VLESQLGHRPRLAQRQDPARTRRQPRPHLRARCSSGQGRRGAQGRRRARRAVRRYGAGNVPSRLNLIGTSCRAAGISTSSASGSASRRRRPSTMPRAPSATPSGRRVTPSTPSTSLWGRSKRPSTPCWMRPWPGRMRTLWPPPPSSSPGVGGARTLARTANTARPGNGQSCAVASESLAEVTRFCEAQIPLDMRHAVRLE